ncbi:MAG: hypothetical protein SVM79_08485 [Chloroflexota bacterium]|nr:hypothetical protein [Chloroflexota bacterium]
MNHMGKKFETKPGYASRFLLIGIVIFLLVSAVGCNQETDASEILARANTAMSELQSYRSETVALYETDEGPREHVSTKEFVAPDRFHFRSTSDDRWPAEVIIIGDQASARSERVWSSHSSPWRRSGESYQENGVVTSSSVAMRNDLHFLNSLIDLEKLADEEIDGANCYHYRGNADMDAVAKSAKDEMAKLGRELPGFEESLEMMRRTEITVDLFIGKDDYLIRRQESNTRRPYRDPDGTEKWTAESMTKRYYDFNAPIGIEPPLDIEPSQDDPSGLPGPPGPPSVDP